MFMASMFTKIQNKQKKILLIESDIELRNTLGHLLIKAGFKVKICRDINLAKTTLDKKLFNLVIFGLNQPVKNSMDLLNQIVSHKQKPEIIVLSSFNLNEMQKEFKTLKIKNVLVKPIKKQAILDCISNIKIPT